MESIEQRKIRREQKTTGNEEKSRVRLIADDWLLKCLVWNFFIQIKTKVKNESRNWIGELNKWLSTKVL